MLHLLWIRPYNIVFMSVAHGVAGWVWGGLGVCRSEDVATSE